jgi:hypothetical protein
MLLFPRIIMQRSDVRSRLPRHPTCSCVTLLSQFFHRSHVNTPFSCCVFCKKRYKTTHFGSWEQQTAQSSRIPQMYLQKLFMGTTDSSEFSYPLDVPPKVVHENNRQLRVLVSHRCTSKSCSWEQQTAQSSRIPQMYLQKLFMHNSNYTSSVSNSIKLSNTRGDSSSQTRHSQHFTEIEGSFPRSQ